MIVKLVEISKSSELSELGKKEESYLLKEIFVNSEHVVCLREDETLKRSLKEGKLVKGLEERQSFTRVYLNRGQSGIDLTVVGETAIIGQKLGLHEKELLKG